MVTCISGCEVATRVPCDLARERKRVGEESNMFFQSIGCFGRNFNLRLLAVGAMFAMTLAPDLARPSFAQPATATANDMITSGLGDQGDVRLSVSKSTVITTNRPQKRVSVGDPAVVDVNGI